MGAGFGGLNKSPDGMVIGLVQWQLPVVTKKEHLAQTAEKICELVRNTKKGTPQLDLIVFPEYALHGLSMSTERELMCTLDGPEVKSFETVCKEMDVWGCFSLMEFNPKGNPFNSGIIINGKGKRVLYYRKLHPWCALEAWEPGDLGIPVCDGPAGSKIALIICHDGMFPEMWLILRFRSSLPSSLARLIRSFGPSRRRTRALDPWVECPLWRCLAF